MTVKRRKRRSRPTPLARIRRFWVLGVMIAAVAIYGGYRLVTAPLFAVHSVGTTGLARVTRDEVIARAAIPRHGNVWLLDRAAIAARIEALPYVLTARVHVAFPATLWLAIVERTPVGCVREVGRRTYTIDASLRVLERGCAAEAGSAYVVRARLAAEPGTFLHDPELSLLLADAAALAATGERFRSFAHDTYGDLEATLASGITVKFGADGDLARKQRLIAPILAELGTRASDVRAVDLRAPATPVVEYRAELATPAPASVPSH